MKATAAVAVIVAFAVTIIFYRTSRAATYLL
jgi:hypothetical protein